jgi:hypothetical protein
MPARRRRTSRIPKASRGAAGASRSPERSGGRDAAAPRGDPHAPPAASPRRERPPSVPVRGGASLDPLAGVELVLIDGNNLVGALTRVGPGPRSSDRGGGPDRGGPERALPPSAVIGRIRGAIPPGVRVELVFDGPPRGGVVGRLATGFNVHYSGRTSADEVIVDAVSRQATEHGPASTWAILVVTDDRDLRDQVRMRGARSAASRWLAGRIAGPGGSGAGPGQARLDTPGSRAAARSGTTIGHGRPPRRPSSTGPSSRD